MIEYQDVRRAINRDKLFYSFQKLAESAQEKLKKLEAEKDVVPTRELIADLANERETVKEGIRLVIQNSRLIEATFSQIWFFLLLSAHCFHVFLIGYFVDWNYCLGHLLALGTIVAYLFLAIQQKNHRYATMLHFGMVCFCILSFAEFVWLVFHGVLSEPENRANIFCKFSDNFRLGVSRRAVMVFTHNDDAYYGNCILLFVAFLGQLLVVDVLSSLKATFIVLPVLNTTKINLDNLLSKLNAQNATPQKQHVKMIHDEYTVKGEEGYERESCSHHERTQLENYLES